MVQNSWAYNIQMLILLTIPGHTYIRNPKIFCDKICMYEEMMTNNDNVGSSLLTSSLLKTHSLYKLHMSSWRSRWTELCSSCIYEVCCTITECGEYTSIYTTRVYYSLHRSIMGCSLRVTRARVTDRECEC